MMTKEFAKQAKAHTRYYIEENGKKVRVPGTTTITGVLAKPVLKYWANKIGLQGIDVRKYVDAAARVGTLAHEMVEYYLAGERLDLSDYTPNEVKGAKRAFRKFIVWAKPHNIKPLLLEYPLVSKTHRFGGTIDFYGDLDGLPTLLDIKTSKALYPEHFLQVAAYALLLEANDHYVARVYILRIGRDEGEGFEERKIDNLNKRWELFRHCLEVYRLTKELK